MSQQTFKSPYRKNITDEKALNLSTKNDQNKRANFNVRFAGNKVRLTVWTGIDGDVENGKMAAVLELDQWYSVLALLKFTIKHRGEGAYANKVELYGLGQDGWKGGPKPRGDIFIGRDSEGTIFISFVLQNRPKIAFKFEQLDFAKLRKKDGSDFLKPDLSEMMASAYLDRATYITAALSATEYVAKEDRPNQNRGGGNNHSNNSGNSNSNSNVDLDSSFDDDLGF